MQEIQTFRKTRSLSNSYVLKILEFRQNPTWFPQMDEQKCSTWRAACLFFASVWGYPQCSKLVRCKLSHDETFRITSWWHKLAWHPYIQNTLQSRILEKVSLHLTVKNVPPPLHEVLWFQELLVHSQGVCKPEWEDREQSSARYLDHEDTGQVIYASEGNNI